MAMAPAMASSRLRSNRGHVDHGLVPARHPLDDGREAVAVERVWCALALAPPKGLQHLVGEVEAIHRQHGRRRRPVPGDGGVDQRRCQRALAGAWWAHEADDHPAVGPGRLQQLVEAAIEWFPFHGLDGASTE